VLKAAARMKTPYRIAQPLWSRNKRQEAESASAARNGQGVGSQH
jgi:hypothetical protein